MKIHDDLIEAYKGHYEYDIVKEHDQYTESLDGLAGADLNYFGTDWAKEKIQSHTPKERLEIYLEWNGIFGYSNRIFEIATGET